MRNLSLHVLDLIESSIRAGATVVAVTIAEDLEQDLLVITVEDNGPALKVSADVATDPSCTTKRGKRAGLGLGLLRAAAERAGGKLELARSSLGGAAVRATMWLSHIDRTPLGDVAATFASVVCTSPDVDLWCTFRVGRRERTVRVSDIVKGFPNAEARGLAVARKVSERIKAGLCELAVMP